MYLHDDNLDRVAFSIEVASNIMRTMLWFGMVRELLHTADVPIEKHDPLRLYDSYHNSLASICCYSKKEPWEKKFLRNGATSMRGMPTLTASLRLGGARRALDTCLTCYQSNNGRTSGVILNGVTACMYPRAVVAHSLAGW
jgi:hypothetical protein